MNKKTISAGKLKGLLRISDEDGIFRMLAIDQRSSLRKMLKDICKRDINFDDMALTKKLITSTLSPYASATLLDPEFGIPESLKYLHRTSGLLVSLEASSYENGGYEGRERKTVLLKEWSVGKVKKLGADAAKLLIYYRPDNTEEIKRYQQEIVKSIGDECRQNDICFVLEPLTYPYLDGEILEDSFDFVERKPSLIIEIAREFSKEEYGVDLLKLEFPVSLRYARGYNYGYFDGKGREEVFSLKDAEDACFEITKVSNVPWVLLSAGVDIVEFIYSVDIASRSGSSGFLAGRAIWKDAIKYFPNDQDMYDFLMTSGVNNLMRAIEASRSATPFYEHDKYRSFSNISLADSSEDWYKKY